jgi:parallel beta-helix repeat protein
MSTRTNLKIAPLIVSFALLITAPTFAGNIIYVDDDAAPSGDGKSWETAFTYLQDALATALSGDEIHVAQGVYKPDQGAGITPGNREATFQLIRGVTLKGGYAGAGTKDPNTRNIGIYKCVLSGDLNGDDRLNFINMAENSYHVVSLSSETTLDGFTVTGGNANGTYPSCNGGGIRLFWSHDVKIYNCIIRGNTTSGFGGGIYLGDSNATLINCVFSGNQAGNSGGGMFGEISDGSTYATLTNCTFVSNSAWNECGGIHMLHIDGVTLTNCILWGNFDSTGMDELAQIYSDDVVANYSCIQGWTGNLRGISTIGADPLFVDADGADNVFGTKDDNFRLLSGSPCIDAGDNLFGIEPEDFTGPPVLIDLDGNPRIVDDPNTQDTGYGTPPVVDMGAYEFQRPCIIFVDDDATGANDGSSWADAFNYLQDALSTAYSGDEVRVAQGIYKPDQGTGITPGDREATFQLINGVTIKGGYAGLGQPDPNARDIELYETILSGDLAGNDVEVSDAADLLYEQTREENSFHVVDGSGTEPTAILDGFLVVGGQAWSDEFQYINEYCFGGGLYIMSGSPTVRNCRFMANTALSYGGGVHMDGNSAPVIVNCGFCGNSATDGGGLNSDYGSPILTGCTFSGNAACSYNADGGFGGGMYNFYSNSKLTDCTFTENSSDEWGGAGGMHNNNSTVIVTNCTFTNNSGGRVGGGGMLNNRGSLILTNCRFIGNSTRRNGGGMDSQETSELTLSNCIFISNSAEDKGGGMCNSSSNPILTNCTFSGNSADNCGGGMYNGGSSGPKITNCIFWGDAPEEINFDSGTIDVTYNDIQGGWLGQGNIDADPLFIEPGYKDANGVWIDGDYHLLPVSPCINTGDPNYMPEPNETDLDGRPRIIGGRIDIGAYEYRFTIAAEAKIIPKTINLASKGNWITSYIWLPEEYDVTDIEPNSILLEDEIKPGEFSVEQQQVATARFSREEVHAILTVGKVELTITGKLTDGTYFEAKDTIKVIDKAEKKRQIAKPISLLPA